MSGTSRRLRYRMGTLVAVVVAAVTAEHPNCVSAEPPTAPVQNNAAGEWPQFLGPQRNGLSNETGLLDSWPEQGPKIVWRAAGGVGMSGLAVSRGRVLTLVQR
ncbi:MAG: hypothetical protein HY000_04860, partial [Planctomycetes bacterium]|nr:hypothetical protein [Planctomycetota bacterium]